MNQRERQIAYIVSLLTKYPEGTLLFGAAKASPEALPMLTQTSISRDIAARLQVPLDETVVEADRTFLGVLLFRAAVDNDQSYFPKLSVEMFAQLRELVTKHPENYDLIEYSLLCNDLGKVAVLCNLFETDHGKPEPDHDTCLYSAVERHADLFPGLAALPAETQALYRDGLKLMATLNLAQFVQGECLPPHVRMDAEISARARNIRLLTEIFDFAGVTGSVHTQSSIVLTDATFTQYTKACAALTIADSDSCVANYDCYLKWRLDATDFYEQWAPPAPDATTIRVFGRLLCLTRETTTVSHIRDALAQLPNETRVTIFAELADTCETRPGVLLYYLPAMFANALGAYTKMLAARKNDSATTIADVLAAVLIRAAACYRKARETGTVDPTTNCITFNVADVANELKTLFE